MADYVTYASGHRFHDQVAVFVGHGQSDVYMSVKEAREFSRGINKICRSIEREEYGASSNLTFFIERDPDQHNVYIPAPINLIREPK